MSDDLENSNRTNSARTCVHDRLDFEVERLIEQARTGSKYSLGLLLERCQRYLLLVANETMAPDLRSKAGASDLVQDTFVEVQRDFLRFQGNTQRELLAWLTRILLHRVANNARHFRQTWKRNVALEVPLDFGSDFVHVSINQTCDVPVNSLIANDEADQLRLAIDRLPHKMREVLFLRTWERQAFADIAARVGGTAESVRKLWGRAVRRLQSELEDLS